MVFKNVKTGKVEQFPGGDINKAQWLKRAKGFCLKFVLGTGVIHRYDGFKEQVIFLSLCLQATVQAEGSSY